MPLWLVLVLAAAVIVTAVILLRRRQRQFWDESTDGPQPAVPFYADEAEVRNLAASLRIELPLAREVKRERGWQLRFRQGGSGIERRRGETAQLGGAIDYGRLARDMWDKLRYTGRLADTLGDEPRVSDRQLLSATTARIERELGPTFETSKTRELLQSVQEAYEADRAQLVASEKKNELRRAAEGSQLVVLTGRFVKTASGTPTSTTVELTHLRGEPSEDPYQHEWVEGPEVPVPGGLALRFVLPNDSAFTPSGRERIDRGQPFFAQVIAHSPSYDEDSGALTCSTCALWGTTNPSQRAPYSPYF